MTIRTHITRQGKVIHLLSPNDLTDAVTSGARLRAACPIHGSDHQRSLSIDSLSLWGYCHCCHATVRVQSPEQTRNGTVQSTVPFVGVCATESKVPCNRGYSSRHGLSFPVGSIQPPSWQQEEQAALTQLAPLLRTSLLMSRRARAYLEERGIPVALAHSCGLGYVSRFALERARAWLSHTRQSLLTRWIGRLVFPLQTPDSCGCIGRTLVGWEPGMDEHAHKAVLERSGMPRRWIKTNPAGWFGFAGPSRLAETLILVEGGFDRLALLAAGIPPSSVVALVGTAARPAWLVTHAPQVKQVVLALDADEGGSTATAHLARAFAQVGIVPLCCAPPHDGYGKDWSERYRRLGPHSAAPLSELLTSQHPTPQHT